MSRVLVVEDSAPLGRMLAETLRRAGHTAQWVATGAAALAEATGCAPDVVLLDLHLAGSDGADVVAELRATAPGCRVIAVSGATPSAAILAEFDAFLLKPVGLDAVLAAISPA